MRKHEGHGEHASTGRERLHGSADADRGAGSLGGSVRRGSIPFVDFGNRYRISGAIYDNRALAGKSTAQTAAEVRNPSTPTGSSVLGAANTITAAVCQITGGQPGALSATRHPYKNSAPP